MEKSNACITMLALCTVWQGCAVSVVVCVQPMGLPWAVLLERAQSASFEECYVLRGLLVCALHCLWGLNAGFDDIEQNIVFALKSSKYLCIWYRYARLLEDAGRSRGRGQQPHEPQCTLTMGEPSFTLTV